MNPVTQYVSAPIYALSLSGLMAPTTVDGDLLDGAPLANLLEPETEAGTSTSEAWGFEVESEGPNVAREVSRQIRATRACPSS